MWKGFKFKDFKKVKERRDNNQSMMLYKSIIFHYLYWNTNESLPNNVAKSYHFKHLFIWCYCVELLLINNRYGDCYGGWEQSRLIGGNLGTSHWGDSYLHWFLELMKFNRHNCMITWLFQSMLCDHVKKIHTGIPVFAPISYKLNTGTKIFSKLVFRFPSFYPKIVK